MEREIKFRAWDWDSKEMVYDVVVYNGVVFKFEEVPDSGGMDAELSLLVEDCEYMQYSGVDDKNGTEIYEGDILVYENSLGVRSNKLGYVVFKRGAFRFMYFDSLDFKSSPINSFAKRHIVIGNVFENTELYKDGLLKIRI